MATQLANAGVQQGSGPKSRWWALVFLALAQFMVVLDGTIVNLALPRLQIEMGISDSTRSWVVTAYALAFGAFLLLGGRIADFWGRKRTFIVAAAGFAVASLIGGIAQEPWELIGARALQGLFAALLAPAALALLTVAFPGGRTGARRSRSSAPSAAWVRRPACSWAGSSRTTCPGAGASS